MAAQGAAFVPHHNGHTQDGYVHGPYVVDHLDQNGKCEVKIHKKQSGFCGWPLPSGRICGGKFERPPCLRRHLKSAHFMAGVHEHGATQARPAPDAAAAQAESILDAYVTSGTMEQHAGLFQRKFNSKLPLQMRQAIARCRRRGWTGNSGFSTAVENGERMRDEANRPSNEGCSSEDNDEDEEDDDHDEDEYEDEDVSDEDDEDEDEDEGESEAEPSRDASKGPRGSGRNVLSWIELYQPEYVRMLREERKKSL